MMEQVRERLERDGGAIIPVYKPVGVTSFAVVQAVRRQLGVRKAGHAGTLDPLASGVLIVGVGTATKQLSQYVGLPKTYEANVRIGEARSTGDLEGVVTEERSVDVDIPEVAVYTALERLVGTHELPVPAYSAVKRGGVRLYTEARAAAKKGESLATVPKRPMEIKEAEVLEVSYKEVPRSHGEAFKRILSLRVRFTVASGVYIRSLAEELGRRLGYPATLAGLIRTAVGEYHLRNAIRLENFGI